MTASQPSDADLLATTIRQYKIGTEVQLDVLRGHETRKVTVKLGPSPRLPREMKKYDDDTFEFRVRDVSPVDRERAGWPESGGVLVESVTEGGWAALGHLAEGDLILAIDGEKVSRCRLGAAEDGQACDRQASIHRSFRSAWNPDVLRRDANRVDEVTAVREAR